MQNVVPIAPIETRRSAASDIDAVAAFIERCWKESYASLLPAETLRSRDRATWRTIVEDSIARGWVAEQGGRIVGYADRSLNNIDNLWVDNGYRRRGIARRLIRALCDDMRARDFANAQIGIESRNREGCRFLEHCGWTPIGDEALRVGAETVGVRVYTRKTASE